MSIGVVVGAGSRDPRVVPENHPDQHHPKISFGVRSPLLLCGATHPEYLDELDVASGTDINFIHSHQRINQWTSLSSSHARKLRISVPSVGDSVRRGRKIAEVNGCHLFET
jgi:hypothetical protein